MVERGKLYLITGGSGFLGDALVERILKMGDRARVMARGKGGLIKLKIKCPEISMR